VSCSVVVYYRTMRSTVLINKMQMLHTIIIIFMILRICFYSISMESFIYREV